MTKLIYRIRLTSYPNCHLNFSNLGKLYLLSLYSTKPRRIRNQLEFKLVSHVLLPLGIKSLNKIHY